MHFFGGPLFLFTPTLTFTHRAVSVGHGNAIHVKVAAVRLFDASRALPRHEPGGAIGTPPGTRVEPGRPGDDGGLERGGQKACHNDHHQEKRILLLST